MNWYLKSAGAGRINLWRGESSHNRGGRFWSTDRGWARQFTQSGLDSEVRGMSMRAGEIWRPEPLPSAVDAVALDRAGGEARAGGFRAFWVDEGPGQPESVYVMGAVREASAGTDDVFDLAERVTREVYRLHGLPGKIRSDKDVRRIDRAIKRIGGMILGELPYISPEEAGILADRIVRETADMLLAYGHIKGMLDKAMDHCIEQSGVMGELMGEEGP